MPNAITPLPNDHQRQARYAQDEQGVHLQRFAQPAVEQGVQGAASIRSPGSAAR